MSIKFIKTTLNAVVLSFAITSASQAAITVSSAPVQIQWTLLYPVVGGGDANIDISSPVGICRGFWLSPTSPAYKEAMAMVLLAKAKSKPVMVWLDESNTNPTSPTAKYCRLYAISVQ